jgi:hypothetical protein
MHLGVAFQDEHRFSFSGIGFVIRGHVAKRKADSTTHTIQAALYIDGNQVEQANFPTHPNESRTDLFWRYQLPPGVHEVTVRVLNPHPDYEIRMADCLIYSDQPAVQHQ